MPRAKLSGSKAEYFGIYSAVTLITGIVVFSFGDLKLAAFFFLICGWTGMLAWRAWRRNDY